MRKIDVFKNEFKNRDGIHFNNAAFSIVSTRVADTVTKLINQQTKMGSLVDLEWIPAIKDAHGIVAECFGGNANQLAFTANCATALSQVAFGLKLKKNESIVVLDQEYASNFYPWHEAAKRSEASLNVIHSDSIAEINHDAILSKIVPGVKAVTLSWVQFQTGAISDLKLIGEKCRSVGAYFIVDGIQAMGQLPISFNDLPIDCLVGGSHKWLCSMNGIGYLLIKEKLLNELEPVLLGAAAYNRVGMTADLECKIDSTAKRFEPGSVGYLPALALAEATKLITETTPEEIATEIKMLSKNLREKLLNLPGIQLVTPFDQAGGITSIKITENTEKKFIPLCRQHKIALSKRGELVRFSLHAFNEEQEIDYVIDLLRKCSEA